MVFYFMLNSIAQLLKQQRNKTDDAFEIGRINV